MLLDSGADAIVENGRGQTALMLAAFRSKAHGVRLLLENAAAVDAKDERSRTALIATVEPSWHSFDEEVVETVGLWRGRERHRRQIWQCLDRSI